MKKILLIGSALCVLFAFVSSCSVGPSENGAAQVSQGTINANDASWPNPYIIVYQGRNYTGASKIWYSSAVYAPFPTIRGYSLSVAYVGDDWNDEIGSYKCINWPLHYQIRFYQDMNYGGHFFTTTIDSATEVVPYTADYMRGWTSGLSSFKEISPYSF